RGDEGVVGGGARGAVDAHEPRGRVVRRDGNVVDLHRVGLREVGVDGVAGDVARDGDLVPRVDVGRHPLTGGVLGVLVGVGEDDATDEEEGDEEGAVLHHGGGAGARVA